MEINVDKTGPCEVKISITISAEEVNEELESTLRQTAEAVAFPGFRKGKAPRKLVLKRFGEIIMEDVREKLIREAMKKTLEDHDLEVVTEPNLDIEKYQVKEGMPLELDFDLEIKPDFELGDYKGLEVEVAPVQVTDQDIDENIKSIQSRFATLETVEDAVVDKKHYLTVDLTFKVEGEDEDLTREKSQCNMALGILDGIEVKDEIERFVGKKTDDEVEIDIPTLPDHFVPENLRGKAAKATAVIREIREITIPELDEEFLKKIGMDSVEALREKITEEVESKRTADRLEEIERKCVDKVIENTPFEVPEKLLMRQIEDQERNLQYEFMRMGLPMEKAVEKVGEFGDKNRDSALRNIKANFIYDKIADREKIFVTENEIENELKTIARQQSASIEDIREYYQEKDLHPGLKSFLRNQKVRALLREKASVTETAPAAEGDSEKDEDSGEQAE